ncbi:ion transporter [Alphaproteobacteria bacterium]|nr:ion transporter [Alphaproteobacteria bacterium]
MTTHTANGISSRFISNLQRFIESNAISNFILGVIICNALILGLETSKTAIQHWGYWLHLLDQVAVVIFVIELAIKLAVYRLNFFKNGWNIFDFIIVTVTLLPVGEGTTILRALRIVRAFRLISIVPSMRLVIHALLNAIPGLVSVIALLSVVFYVGSVMATMLFGEQFQAWFGTIGASLFSLFQIMTLESWSMGIARPVMEQFPLAWLFFIPFILCTSFAVLNLFIAIIVSAMDDVQRADRAPATSNDDIINELKTLRTEIAALKKTR